MKSALLRPTKRKRILFFLLTDIIIFTASLYASFHLWLNFTHLNVPNEVFTHWTIGSLLIKITTFWIWGIYRFTWRFIGMVEMFKSVLALATANGLAIIINAYLQQNSPSASLPLNVLLIDYMISLHGVLATRSMKRIYLELFRRHAHTKRTLIVGAGNTAERIARELSRGREYRPVCFVDDDPHKVGTTIHNVKVRGRLEDLPQLLLTCRIEAVIIALPHLPASKIRHLFNIASDAGIRDIKIIPSITKMNNPDIVSAKDLRDLSPKDLLARETVSIEMDKVCEFIKGKTVLVTGAGGSIGSEIVRQLDRFAPQKIVALEIDDTELHQLSIEIQRIHQCTESQCPKFVPVIADIKDTHKLQRVFEQYHPHIVFHAAAYKHVPLIESFPEEAVKVNILGTYHLAHTSIQHGVEKFINISTDKAVNPTSVMGATKRMAEVICSTLNNNEKTRFISVRFGNVLGTRGSVIPLFLEQIRRGGPITVTHPQMKRYFMTVQEAVLLVLQAAAIGNGGEVFVLDMGEPVKILKLTEQLIKLAGLEPYKDIEIQFTGLRPGEKLFEELLTAEEGTEKTYHQKIYVARTSQKVSSAQLEEILAQFNHLSQNGSLDRLKQLLQQYVPFYHQTPHSTT